MVLTHIGSKVTQSLSEHTVPMRLLQEVKHPVCRSVLICQYDMNMYSDTSKGSVTPQKIFTKLFNHFCKRTVVQFPYHQFQALQMNLPSLLLHQLLKIHSNTYIACTTIEQVAIIHFIDLLTPKMWPMLCMFPAESWMCRQNKQGVYDYAILQW